MVLRFSHRKLHSEELGLDAKEVRSCAQCGVAFPIFDHRRQHHKKFCSCECQQASWKEQHPSKFAAYNTDWRRRNGVQPQKYGIDLVKRKIRTDRYHERYPEREQQHRAIQNARRRGMVGTYTLDEWQQRLEEFFGRCAYCFAPATHRDHLIPVAGGGTNDIGNIVPACRLCNQRKNKSSLVVFLMRRAHGKAA